MTSMDHRLARARSKANRVDTRKDEARAFTRASRRAGKVSPRDVEPEATMGDDVATSPVNAVDSMTHEEARAAEFARWEEKREVARTLSVCPSVG